MKFKTTVILALILAGLFLLFAVFGVPAKGACVENCEENKSQEGTGTGHNGEVREWVWWSLAVFVIGVVGIFVGWQGLKTWREGKKVEEEEKE